MGNSVNLAARLEGVNKMYGTDLIISEMTYNQCATNVVVRELDLIRVVGIFQPVRIYELLSRPGELSADEQKAFSIFAEGLALYRSQQWQAAISKFEMVVTLLTNDGPSKIMISRCRDYLDAPLLENWDGVYIAKTK